MRAFVLMAVGCIIIALCMTYVPACQPKDVSDCTWVENHYECPEGK